MGKSKITLELEDEIIAKIKEIMEKNNNSPLGSMKKFNNIEEFLATVITSQIQNAGKMEKMSEKLKESIQKLSQSLGDMGINPDDFNEIFGDSEKPKENTETKPDKNNKN